MCCGGFTVPKGYRFHPSDEELLSHYLEQKNKCKDSQITTIIPEIDVCKHEPRELPDKPSPEPEHHQFQLLMIMIRKPSRSNRTTGEGFWKITGKDRAIKAPGSKAVIGRKRTLTFYKRGVLKSQKTNWVIHEYYLIQAHSDPPKQIGDFVICCLKYKSDNSDYDKDAPFCNQGSSSCSMASNVENQADFRGGGRYSSDSHWQSA